MLTLLTHILESGQIPTSLTTGQRTFGLEVELRWKRYHNSKVEYVRVWYAPTEVELLRCTQLLEAVGLLEVVHRE